MKFLIIPFLLISFQVMAQCKTSRKSANGEIINCVDNNNLKQGKWSVQMPGLRGEPGYDEEGVYKDGKKEGVWRMYTLIGDLFAIEKYRWGYRDGVSQYFNIAGITREESWKAVNPENPYDTVDVPDVYDGGKVYRKVVKIEGTSVKHGSWKYYNDGLISKTEKYFLGKLEDPNQRFLAGGEVAPADTLKTKIPVKVKPPGVIEFEKKNAGKKKIKVIDGKTF